MADAALTSSNNLEGPVLPEDIVVEIFSRLPVKILMRFKCVCKSWYAIVSNPSPTFISKHLQNSYNNKTNDHGCLLVQYSTSQPDRSRSTALFSDPTLSALDYHPFDIFSLETHLLGPCNGIFFLGIYALWNPATKEYKLLPLPPLEPNDPDENVISETRAFGLNPLINEDYKVVIIREFIGHLGEDSKYPPQVLVYSANDNSWVSFDFPWRYWIKEAKCYMYLNGVYYWMAYEPVPDGDQYVISFDMGNNSFQQVIPAPAFGLVFRSSLVLYRDSIGWVYFDDDNGRSLHMWVMDQDGDSRVWTKQFTIGPFMEPRYPFGCQPFGYWKNDQLIVLSGSEAILLFDPAGGVQGIKNLGLHIDLFYLYVLIYKESLVSIKGETYVPGEVPLSLQEHIQAFREYEFELLGEYPNRIENP